MTPYEHSLLSQRDWGGRPEDYLQVHEFLDQTKMHWPHWTHRMLLHNSWGMGLCEQVFGAFIMTSDQVPVSTREIARRHITQDLAGKVPTIQDWMVNIKITKQPWMNQPMRSELTWLKQNVYGKEDQSPGINTNPSRSHKQHGYT